MKLFASVALLLALTMPILAQEPQEPQEVSPPVAAPAEAKIVLVAPTSARVGELVRLDVSESSADSYKWILIPDSVDFLVYDSGARAVFSARGPGEYRFIVACAKGSTVDVVTHVVKVLGSPEQPTTDSLTEWIPYWNGQIGLPKEECERVATVFESVAGRALTLNGPQEWWNTTSEDAKKALGDRAIDWKPLLDKIGAALHKRATSGIITTQQDYAKAWLEVAQGLRNS